MCVCVGREDECTCLQNQISSGSPGVPFLLLLKPPLPLFRMSLFLSTCGETPSPTQPPGTGSALSAPGCRQDGGGGRRARTKGAFIAVGSGWLPTDNGHILGSPKTNSCVQPALLRWAAGGKKWESSVPFWSGLARRRGKSASRSQRWRFLFLLFFLSHVETKANKGQDGPGGEINRPTWRFRCWLVFIFPLTPDLHVARVKKKRRRGCSLERAFVSCEESDISQTRSPVVEGIASALWSAFHQAAP